MIVLQTDAVVEKGCIAVQDCEGCVGNLMSQTDQMTELVGRSTGEFFLNPVFLKQHAV